MNTSPDVPAHPAAICFAGNAAPVQGVSAPAAAPAASRPADPLEELFGGPAPAAAAAPVAVAAAPVYAATDFFGHQVPSAAYGPPPPAASMQMGPGSGSLASHGSYGMPSLGSVAAGPTGFTSGPSWSSVGLHPAASASSSHSAVYDHFAHAAVPGTTGPASVPVHQQPQQHSAIGFDDSAFGPVDDWRVLGDLQQWHRALLTKDKVCHIAVHSGCSCSVAHTSLECTCGG